MPDAPPDQPATHPTGYLHPQFARSYHGFGTPRELPRCGGWILERRIPGFPDHDAMGCYPLFACQRWSQLPPDLDDLGTELVSLTLVTDPFGDYTESCLRQCFADFLVPFKAHYVIDLDKPRDQVVSRGHRKSARKALRQLSVSVHPNPPDFLDTWMHLYSQLIARHNITGIAAFSRSAFAEQLSTPGMVLIWARYGDEPVAAILWLVHGDVAYGHVLGCTQVGYRWGAQYAVIWTALEHFTGSVRWIDLMGVPGAQDAGSRGLRQYKLGWTTETRMAWLCGRILNRQRYADLARATGTSQARYFPAYRDGELARFNQESPPAGTDMRNGREP